MYNIVGNEIIRTIRKKVIKIINMEKYYKKINKAIRKEDKLFYKAFQCIKDENKRNAIYAVYSFVSYTNKLVNDTEDISRLNTFNDELDAFVKKKEVNNYMFELLDNLSKSFYPKDYNYKPYYSIIKSKYIDYMNKEFATYNELKAYLRLSGTSVGLMLGPIVDPELSLKDYLSISRKLGLAIKITNIYQNFKIDILYGKIYFPQDLITKYNVSKDKILKGKITPEFINMFNYLYDIANDYYDRSYEQIKTTLTGDNKKALLYLLVSYQETLKSHKLNNYKKLSKKIVLSNQKLNDLYKKVDIDTII